MVTVTRNLHNTAASQASFSEVSIYRRRRLRTRCCKNASRWRDGTLTPANVLSRTHNQWRYALRQYGTASYLKAQTSYRVQDLTSCLSLLQVLYLRETLARTNGRSDEWNKKLKEERNNKWKKNRREKKYKTRDTKNKGIFCSEWRRRTIRVWCQRTRCWRHFNWRDVKNAMLDGWTKIRRAQRRAHSTPFWLYHF